MLIQDNSIHKRCTEAPSPRGDTSLHLVAVLRVLGNCAFGLEIHSGPELSWQHREKGP
jgi:hypothetical protein